ncbi:hypothetical protein PR202_ga11451 [Eleusine coracana subsp. coracana]|uniref:Uncharacterized protein n=1 Tax=Eleusine coracana subsp. coracana TaxID=191504 RepID=A0AAV5C9I6_ELECO|nr:hypothetical protein PR202_ga11451 [Eleusine coracana subsp. coracana]
MEELTDQEARRGEARRPPWIGISGRSGEQKAQSYGVLGGHPPVGGARVSSCVSGTGARKRKRIQERDSSHLDRSFQGLLTYQPLECIKACCHLQALIPMVKVAGAARIVPGAVPKLTGLSGTHVHWA